MDVVVYSHIAALGGEKLIKVFSSKLLLNKVIINMNNFKNYFRMLCSVTSANHFSSILSCITANFHAQFKKVPFKLSYSLSKNIRYEM